jgi:glycosyltransferase involved in cell wall biosynthesis
MDTIIESMADGVPVIASDLAATRELISDGIDGRLVPPDRAAELSRAMRVVVDYPGEASQLGIEARRKVQTHFTWEHSTRRLLEVFHRVAERKSSWQGPPVPISP